MSTLHVSLKRGSMTTLRPTHYIWMVISFIVVTERMAVGGGIVCYVSSYLDIQLLSEFESEAVESLWLLFRGQRMLRLVIACCCGHCLLPS